MTVEVGLDLGVAMLTVELMPETADGVSAVVDHGIDEVQAHLFWEGGVTPPVRVKVKGAAEVV